VQARVEARAVDGIAGEHELLGGVAKRRSISPRTISELQITALRRGEAKRLRSASRR
jgi:hypothetical protein